MPYTQILEFIIIGVLAAVVLYNLYAVLGRRIGRQPGGAASGQPPGATLEGPGPETGASPDVELTGLAALKDRDPSFDVDKFLQGARAAYEMIVRAFASGDRATLKGLLSEQVMTGFESAMAERESQGRSEEIVFEHPPRTDIEDTQVGGDLARIRVRYLAEFISREKTPEGETSQERRTAEAWTFERNLTSRDPNWMLVRVDAAEA
jgi:predicted lipid-binding transport protein (Tim44 family)